MAYFIFPQKWIASAIAAAAMSFGPINNADDVHIKYYNLKGPYLTSISKPDTIWIDKRPRSSWPKWIAQCAIVHEYGRLAGRKNSANPKSIMHPTLHRGVCLRYLRNHRLR